LKADVDVAKRHELHTFAVIPQRWVVERSFAWLKKCRRLWKNCEGIDQYPFANGGIGIPGVATEKNIGSTF